MAHLATVAATRVNSVAELQSRLLRDKVLPDFAHLWPEKFTNVTNGVSPRRFICLADPNLSRPRDGHHRRRLGHRSRRFRDLEPYAGDPAFRAAFRAVKQANKERLATLSNLRGSIRPTDTSSTSPGQAAARIQTADSPNSSMS